MGLPRPLRPPHEIDDCDRPFGCRICDGSADYPTLTPRAPAGDAVALMFDAGKAIANATAVLFAKEVRGESVAADRWTLLRLERRVAWIVRHHLRGSHWATHQRLESALCYATIEAEEIADYKNAFEAVA